MRIAVVTETYPPEVNGVSLTVQGLVTGMAEDGHEMLLVRPFQPGVSTLPPPRPISELLVRGAALPKYPGLRFGFPAGRALEAPVRRETPGCGLCRDRRTARLVGRANRTTARHSGRDRIPHPLRCLRGSVRSRAPYAARPLLAAAPAQRLGRDGRAHPELREWLERHGFQRVRVVARGVDTRLFDPARRRQKLRERWGIAPDGLAVIYVGRIAAEKNLSLAIEAFRRIRERRPDARFVWVGTGPLAARLRQEHPEFIFTGLRLGEDLAEHFASADLFLFPSLTETFGNVTIEAMASGVPTIAFDYGAARAHLRDREHGRFVANGDDASFIAAAVEVATDAGRRRLMSAAARRAALGLRPERVARDFVGNAARCPRRCHLSGQTHLKGTVTFKWARPGSRRDRPL